ncbi:MAG: flagellar brake protein [Phycisphaerales bacterium]|nr:flagellar brake protein [Phycisphaerales bacterium]
MTPTQTPTPVLFEPVGQLWVDHARRDEIIRDAAVRHTDVQLTRYGGSGWKTYVSRFVGANKDGTVVWIDAPMNDAAGGSPTLRVGEQVGISFRRGRCKCLFTTTVTDADGLQPQDGSAAVPGGTDGADGRDAEAVAIRWPENLQEMQRRVYQRVTPPHGHVVNVTVYPHCLTDGPVQAAGVVPRGGVLSEGRLANLSAGGLCTSATEKPPFRDGDLVIIRFSPRPGGEPLQLDSRVRHVMAAPGNRWSVGFQFVGLETTTTGQCRLAELATIVSAFRRAAARG